MPPVLLDHRRLDRLVVTLVLRLISGHISRDTVERTASITRPNLTISSAMLLSPALD